MAGTSRLKSRQMIRVHGVPPSPFVRKLLLALELKNLDYELNIVFGGSDDKEFRKISPLGKVPVLEHDGFALPDTSVICRYVDRLFPEPRLYPEDPKLEAWACWLEELGDSQLMDACSGLYMQRFVIPKLYGGETDESVVEQILRVDLPALLDYVDSKTPESGPLVGDAISIADLTMVSCFLTARYGDFEVDAATHPRLAAYLARALNHDLVQSRMESERRSIEQLLPK